MTCKYLLFPVMAWLCLSSCSPTLYFPERANNPVLKEKGDATLMATIKPSLSGPADSMHNNSIVSPAFDAAYAITDHLAIIASFRSTVGKEIGEKMPTSFFDSKTDTVMGGVYNGYRFEVGAGYYTTFGSKGRFEIFGGGGAGSMNRISHALPQFDFDGKYIRVFAQSAVGISSKDIVSITGGVRLAGMQYYRFNAANPRTQHIVIDDFGSSVTSALQLYMEPFINFEIGYKFIKFNGQFGTSLPITPISAAAVGGALPYVSLGITFSYAKRYMR